MSEHLFTNGFVSGGRLVFLGRDSAATLTRTTFPAEWCAFVRVDQVPDDVLRQLKGAVAVQSIRREGAFWRVGFRDRDLREKFCSGQASPFARYGILTYEGDVDPVRRWLTDCPDARIQLPRRGYLDLETDSRVPPSRAVLGQARILSWVLGSGVEGERRVRTGLLAEDTDAAEQELIAALFEEAERYDQLAAWGGERFDFPILAQRAEQRGVRYERKRWLLVDQMLVVEKMNRNASQNAEEKRSMALGRFSRAIGVQGKLEELGIVPGKPLGAQTRELYDAGGKWRDLLVKYMVRDATTQFAVERKTGYLDLFGTLCEVATIFPNQRALGPVLQMDAFMLRLGAKEGVRFPTRHFVEGDSGQREDEQFRGALVMKPRASGIERAVHVVDFKSLYPTCILTWNISSDTRRMIAASGPIPEGHCRSPLTGVGFSTTEEGLLPKAIRELLRLRKHWKELQQTFPPGTPEWVDAGRRSNAYKVAANSYFGASGNRYSRHYDRAVAESIAQNARWLIQLTMGEVEKKGWKCLYSDTDSCFVQGPSDEEFEAFVKWLNAEFYPEELAKIGCHKSSISLAYEKKLDRIVFCDAKKRYVARYTHFGRKSDGTGWNLATEQSKPEVKGLEYKRGDSSRLTTQLQTEVIDLLVGGQGVARGEVPTEDVQRYHEVVSRMCAHVFGEALPIEEIVISKGISRDLDDYAVKEGRQDIAHVKIAKELRDRGEDIHEGSRVEYVVVDADVSPMVIIPAADYRPGVEIDRHYIWERVWTSTRRVLEAAFPDEDWGAWTRTRPAKSKGGPLAGQLALGELSSAVLVFAPERSRAAPPVPTAPEFVIVIDQARVPRGLGPIHTILKRHPGKRQAVLKLRAEGGAEVSLMTVFHVSGTETLVRELRPYRGHVT